MLAAGARARVQVDMCIFNNMGDSDRCRLMDPAKVKIFHFTVCQKPWYAYVAHLPTASPHTHLSCKAARMKGLQLVDAGAGRGVRWHFGCLRGYRSCTK